MHVPPTRRAFLSTLGAGVAACAAQPATCYVDSAAGDDAFSGRGPEQAWRSLRKVNDTTFRPGDRILFRAGGSWTGQLRPGGSGASGRPIVVDSYGAGDRPAIHGNGATAAVYLRNQQYWEINNLEITNDAPAEGYRRGVLIRGDNPGRSLRHIHL